MKPSKLGRWRPGASKKFDVSNGTETDSLQWQYIV